MRYTPFDLDTRSQLTSTVHMSARQNTAVFVFQALQIIDLVDIEFIDEKRWILIASSRIVRDFSHDISNAIKSLENGGRQITEVK